LDFVCRTVTLTVENNQSMFSSTFEKGQSVNFPVAHHDGNFFADSETLDRLESEGRVVFRYIDNPNGSARNIAGIMNDSGNVLGLMPHPERVISPLLGGVDGAAFFKGLVEAVG